MTFFKSSFHRTHIIAMANSPSTLFTHFYHSRIIFHPWTLFKGFKWIFTIRLAAPSQTDLPIYFSIRMFQRHARFNPFHNPRCVRESYYSQLLSDAINNWCVRYFISHCRALGLSGPLLLGSGYHPISFVTSTFFFRCYFRGGIRVDLASTTRFSHVDSRVKWVSKALFASSSAKCKLYGRLFFKPHSHVIEHFCSMNRVRRRIEIAFFKQFSFAVYATPGILSFNVYKGFRFAFNCFCSPLSRDSVL